MFKKFCDKGGLCFLGGIVAAIAVPKVLKSDCARKAAVSTLAEGMKLKEDAQASFVSMKEDADDVLAEAKNKNK